MSRIVPVVAYLFVDAQRRVLLTQRLHTNPDYPGHWEFGGGKVEPGESLAQAARREAEEELGWSITPRLLLGQVQVLLQDRDIHLSLLYCEHPPTPPECRQIARYAWVDPSRRLDAYEPQMPGMALLWPLVRRVLGIDQAPA